MPSGLDGLPGASHRLHYAAHARAYVMIDFTSPESEDSPALSREFIIDFPVSLDVALDLRNPEFGVGSELSFPAFAPAVAVPEFAVTEYGYFHTREREVRSAGDRILLTVAEASLPHG